MYLTLRELTEKLEKAIKRLDLNDESEIITDAWVAGSNDQSFPEGTVIFECTCSNLNRPKIPEDQHVLSIQPTKTSKYLN